jgi:hypothetical protein
MLRIFVILSLLQAVAFWKILPRMGFPAWLAIMASIPLLNLVVLYYLALNPWPRERQWPPANRAGGGPSDAEF